MTINARWIDQTHLILNLLPKRCRLVSLRQVLKRSLLLSAFMIFLSQIYGLLLKQQLTLFTHTSILNVLQTSILYHALSHFLTLKVMIITKGCRTGDFSTQDERACATNVWQRFIIMAKFRDRHNVLLTSLVLLCRSIGKLLVSLTPSCEYNLAL